jgi:hypothetical protein
VARELERDSYAWDSKVFPDGRYEFKVVADDGPGNARMTKLWDNLLNGCWKMTCKVEARGCLAYSTWTTKLFAAA